MSYLHIVLKLSLATKYQYWFTFYEKTQVSLCIMKLFKAEQFDFQYSAVTGIEHIY